MNVNHVLEPAPAGPYEPDESYMEQLFARPARPKEKPEPEVWIAGEAFNGIDLDDAARRRHEALHRRPTRVKEEKQR